MKFRRLKNNREELLCSNLPRCTRGSFFWNNVECLLDATRSFYWYILSSTCFGYIRPSSGALDVELQHMVFLTEFLDGWWSWQPLRRSCVRCGWCRARQHTHRTHDLRSGSQDHHPSKNSVQKTILLQLNIQYSWWWAYISETCRAKHISIKLPCCIKLAFHIISWGRCTVKQSSKEFICLKSPGLRPLLRSLGIIW